MVFPAARCVRTAGSCRAQRACFFTIASSPSFLLQFSNANDESTRSISVSDRPRKASA